MDELDPSSAEQRALDGLGKIGVLEAIRLFGPDATAAYGELLEIMTAASAQQVANRLPRPPDADSIKGFQRLFRPALEASRHSIADE